MNAVSTAIIDRVKKLLALLQSANAHESASALAKANAIIVEHQIDMVLLNSSDPAMPEAYDEQMIGCTRRKRIEIKAIASLLEEHFRCRVVYTYARRRGILFPSMTVIGRRTDAEFGRWLVSYLREEFMRHWTAFKQTASATTREKNAFIFGMYKGLDERLSEERAHLVERHIAKIAAASLPRVVSGASSNSACVVPAILLSADATNGLATRYAIAVQTEAESLDQEMRRLHPDLHSGRAYRVNLFQKDCAMAAGKASGRTISCNRPIGPGA